MKIAIGGIATESCTFSVLSTKLEDFRIIRPNTDDFANLYPFLKEYEDIEFVGTLSAKALPGGPVEPSAYETIQNELLSHLKEHGPFDGIYLDMHGAMNVADRDDAEGDWIVAIRDIVGDDCLISASYDLHGNVSERIMKNIDIITGFRTAPHIDYMETRERAMSLLVRCIREGIRPKKAFVKIPVGLPGEKTSTEWEPGMSIYNEIIPQIDGNKVMDATIQVGYVWADEPRMTACAIAIGLDEDAIQQAASHLAQVYWDRRADFEFGVPALSVDECIQQAMQDTVKPVLISDSGDNPTAGGVGDVTYFLSRALDINPKDMIYASIPDTEAVSACINAGLGNAVSLSIGGKWDTRNSQPLDVSGVVEFIKADEENPQVILKVGGIRIILTSKRTPFHYRQQFIDLGIIPEDHDIVVVKIGYLVPELKAMAEKAYLALSVGAVNQDIVKLPYQRIGRPCYPFDPDMSWSPNVLFY